MIVVYLIIYYWYDHIIFHHGSTKKNPNQKLLACPFSKDKETVGCVLIAKS